MRHVLKFVHIFNNFSFINLSLPRHYGGYPIIKQNLSVRDLSRDSICMQTQL